MQLEMCIFGCVYNVWVVFLEFNMLKTLLSFRHGQLHVVQETVDLGFESQDVSSVTVLASNEGYD